MGMSGLRKMFKLASTEIIQTSKRARLGLGDLEGTSSFVDAGSFSLSPARLIVRPLFSLARYITTTIDKVQAYRLLT